MTKIIEVMKYPDNHVERRLVRVRLTGSPKKKFKNLDGQSLAFHRHMEWVFEERKKKR